MAISKLSEAMTDELRDLLSAERQIKQTLPTMAAHAASTELRDAFEEHLGQTEGHITRLEKVFSELGISAEPKKCAGIAGIISEGGDMLKKGAEGAISDALLIASAQKVEHYEMASYGTVCNWLEQTGHKELCDVLNETLSEEKETDAKLIALAEKLNPKAASA
jgi:ferritin-like metal-binding protein YciE